MKQVTIYFVANPTIPVGGIREANGILRIGTPGGGFSLPLMSHEVFRVIKN